ncbi:hypothetical protein BJ508DRAFT_180756 [Ascobolus immersus RN42]|uniref:Uncharacterized protein n=1 Tax=Ascobolus immersus RN42 TaxID=1160509 RepID=A0A3N4HY61_ASCIM|nr:hypothetical protein BJ508DRAFT_180756 [Ascobolus immersus RN42]
MVCALAEPQHHRSLPDHHSSSTTPHPHHQIRSPTLPTPQTSCTVCNCTIPLYIFILHISYARPPHPPLAIISSKLRIPHTSYNHEITNDTNFQSKSTKVVFAKRPHHSARHAPERPPPPRSPYHSPTARRSRPPGPAVDRRYRRRSPYPPIDEYVSSRRAPDDRHPRDGSRTRSTREARDLRGARDARDWGESRDRREERDWRESRESRHGRDGRDGRGGRDGWDARDGREGRISREVKSSSAVRRRTGPGDELPGPSFSPPRSSSSRARPPPSAGSSMPLDDPTPGPSPASSSTVLDEGTSAFLHSCMVVDTPQSIMVVESAEWEEIPVVSVSYLPLRYYGMLTGLLQEALNAEKTPVYTDLLRAKAAMASATKTFGLTAMDSEFLRFREKFAEVTKMLEAGRVEEARKIVEEWLNRCLLYLSFSSEAVKDRRLDGKLYLFGSIQRI